MFRFSSAGIMMPPYRKKPQQLCSHVGNTLTSTYEYVQHGYRKCSSTAQENRQNTCYTECL